MRPPIAALGKLRRFADLCARRAKDGRCDKIYQISFLLFSSALHKLEF